MSQLPLFNSDITAHIDAICEQLAVLPEAERVAALNQVRQRLHQCSPFAAEPVDLVLWVPGETVAPNDYNPNRVASPEMDLLQVSIIEDHFTQPIVVHAQDGAYTVIDGEHRHRVGSTGPLARRLHGYLPVTVAHTQTESDRRAATVRHNRARGVHKLDPMSDIVLSLRRAGWPDDKIARHLGMDADEILRMQQVAGIAKVFAQPDYNRAWINDDGQSELDPS